MKDHSMLIKEKMLNSQCQSWLIPLRVKVPWCTLSTSTSSLYEWREILLILPIYWRNWLLSSLLASQSLRSVSLEEPRDWAEISYKGSSHKEPPFLWHWLGKSTLLPFTMKAWMGTENMLCTARDSLFAFLMGLYSLMEKATSVQKEPNTSVHVWAWNARDWQEPQNENSAKTFHFYGNQEMEEGFSIKHLPGIPGSFWLTIIFRWLQQDFFNITRKDIWKMSEVLG